MNSQKTVVTLKPIRGKEQDLLKLNVVEGAVLIATDTGKMFMDANGKRVSIGGSGSPFIYSEAGKIDPDEEGIFTIPFSDLESEDTLPQVNGLLINADGTFYRVMEVDQKAELMKCIRIAVSGSGDGGGGGGLAKAIKITGTALKTVTLVNGQSASTAITVFSAIDSSGDPMDSELSVNWEISNTSDGIVYERGVFRVRHGEPYNFDFGKHLRESTSSTIILQASGVNSGVSRKLTYSVSTVKMELLENVSFTSKSVYQSREVIMSCDVRGNLEKILDFYIDGDLVQTRKLNKGDVGTISASARNVPHGFHKVRIELYQSIDGDKGVGVKPIEFEIAVTEPGRQDPIIWLGNYKEKYYNYDSIKIPFYVYNPASVISNVRFFKGIVEFDNSPRQVENNSPQILQITDAPVGQTSVYYIRVGEDGEISREIQIEVEKDPKRLMELSNPANLLVNFDPAGRSNDESATRRQSWSYRSPEGKVYNGDFKNFNWYNNGWITDDKKDTLLRISNGAEFSIPLGAMDINTEQVGRDDVTFEFQFKVRNVQDYSTIVKEITRYQNDGQYFGEFQAQRNNPDGFKNYDQFLANKLKDQPELLESLTSNFDGIQKEINLSSVFCKYYDDSGNTGFCLGPQDGFFSTRGETVSVRYVEDQMVNLSIVFSNKRKDGRIYIYLNGVLSGVSNVSSDGVITINSPKVVFNSKSCDIDLYRFRVYKAALSVVEIGTNFAVDHKDVLTYDHTNLLAKYNSELGEYQLDFQSMLTFNEENPEDFLMPYMVIETAGTDKLPHSKADKKTVSIEFVNTGLDRAFATGALEELASKEGYSDDDEMTAVQKYYMHHSPSWKGDGISLSVQGTSSEFYPRRNYKAKTKDKKGLINMHMHKGPFSSAYLKNPESTRLEQFYMDNKTVGTTKFTFKIDYMESSGTYNMGFANLIKTAYSKHPLNDYNKAGAFEKENKEYVLATGEFEPKAKYFEDSKGKKKVKFGDDKQYQPNQYYKEVLSYEPYSLTNLADFRTSVQGFPVLTFWKQPNGEYTFIGRYNMLLDKGSDECYGFKLPKNIVTKFTEKKAAARKVAECWEFSNNNRTFCSFRNPGHGDEDQEEKNYKFDFLVKDQDGRIIKNSKGSCPVVVDSFEYRYHEAEDLLDYIYTGQASSEDEKREFEKDWPGITDENGSARNDAIKKYYEHWEKFVSWVWSTCTDNVPSLGTYDKIELFEGLYERSKYYTYNGDVYSPSSEDFDPEKTYYKKAGPNYTTIKLTNQEDKVYRTDTYYENRGGVYLLDNGVYDPSKTYYRLNESSSSNARTLSEPVTYGSKTYTKDTKEYRLDKFRKEFDKHIDREYALVYFIMTEVFLCYDSRGKNAMFASWGPLEKGGDYKWYPIFYDIDTQLGINNTGIPSYDYFVNAQEDGCFSTSDSVLWKNLFVCFFEDIKGMYERLKNNILNVNAGKELPGPIKGVEHIEDWYLARPYVKGLPGNIKTNAFLQGGSFAWLGARPMIALNMDEFYKYISITNPRIGYQKKDGSIERGDKGTFFYALQGDRSLSRQQFLTRRINFIDSWLSQGDYSRSSGNAIRGRIAANNPLVNSDKWIEGTATNGVSDLIPNSPYYEMDTEGRVPKKDERGYPKKTNYLDADVFVEMTPYQQSYVTFGDDNEAFASKPYEGAPVRFDFPSTLTTGIKTSGNYPEQLLYIYGAKSLKDVGDISKLYWTEFYAESCPHLSRILLGNDHPDFYNKGLKMPSFEANLIEGQSDGTAGKPLLKEVNLNNVRILAGSSSANFDFTSSEKLEIFKAVGSNIENIKFAKGVALHTLHLPLDIKKLELIEARGLTELLDHKPTSQYSAKTDVWTAEKGLYIAGLTDVKESEIETADSLIGEIILEGGSLGYNSFKIIDTLYKIKKRTKNELKIKMTGLDWTPYKRLDDGYEYKAEEAAKYFVDDGHYGFRPYENYQSDKWEIAILNGEIYKYDDSVAEELKKSVKLQMFKDFASMSNFKNTTSLENNKVPELEGDIFVDNSEESPLDEGYIKNTLQKEYPKVRFRFSNVKKAYSATFILPVGEEVTELREYEVVGTQKISQDDTSLKTWFTHPSRVQPAYKTDKPHFDFVGWSTSLSELDIIPEDEWDSKRLEPDKYDYKFYALFKKHVYSISFQKPVGEGQFQVIETIKIKYGENLRVPKILPSIDESKLALDRKYKFLGYTQDKKNIIAKNEKRADVKKVDRMIATQDYVFYAVFTEVSVYDSPTPEEYFTFVADSYSEHDSQYNIPSSGGYIVKIKDGVRLEGKITIPTYHEGLPVIGIVNNGFSASNGKGTNITHIFFARKEGMPIKIRKIEDNAFNECINLVYIDLPEGLRVIGKGAFLKCSSLQLYAVGRTIYSIGDQAFNQAIANMPGKDHFDFVIGPSVTKIGTGAFSYNAGRINKLTLGDASHATGLTLETMGDRVVYQNSGKEMRQLEIYSTVDGAARFSSGLILNTGDPTSMSKYHFQLERVDGIHYVHVK